MVERTSLPLWSFQGAREPCSQRRTAQRAVSQNSAAWSTPRSTFVLGTSARTAEAINERDTYRSNCFGIPRKEVIQPQLPLRLPCYDFTPVTDPTFDGSLPCGLGHRLRVLPASVV